jgi:hypothetical protein
MAMTGSTKRLNLIEGLDGFLVDKLWFGILHQANLNHKRFQFIQCIQRLSDRIVLVKILGGTLQKSVAHLWGFEFREFCGEAKDLLNGLQCRSDGFLQA